MRRLGRLLARLRARRAAPAGGYGPEVLLAGWVQLPPAFRDRPQGEPKSARRTLPA